MSTYSFQYDPKNRNQCKLCGHVCKGASGLRYHMMRHAGKFPYNCPYCLKGFPGTTDLKHHLKRVHGLTGYVCLYCANKFGAIGGLVRHLKGEGGEECAQKHAEQLPAGRNWIGMGLNPAGVELSGRASGASDHT